MAAVITAGVAAARYDRVAVALHWIIALLVLGQIGLGWFMVDLPKGPDRGYYFALHKSLGLTTAFLIFLRIVWRLTHKPPPLPDWFPDWQSRAAEWTHRLLYAGDSAMTRVVLPSIRSQHIRFLREARAAAPVRVECGQASYRDRLLTAVAVMRHNATDEPLAAFQVEIDTQGWHMPWPRIASVEPPEWTRPRGIDPGTLPRPPASRAAAIAAGFQVVGRGVIGNDECGSDGSVLAHVYHRQGFGWHAEPLGIRELRCRADRA